MAFTTSDFAVGYDSPSQFSREYNRVYGDVNPTRYTTEWDELLPV